MKKRPLHNFSKTAVAFFHFYDIQRDDVDYILETFPIVKKKDEKEFGEYRTKNLILEIYHKMQHSIIENSDTTDLLKD